MDGQADEYRRRKIDSYVGDLEQVLLEATLHQAQLEEGLITRTVIGEAVGILMVQNRCSAEEAFETLKTASQHSNIKLRHIALRLVSAVEEAGKQGTGERDHARGHSTEVSPMFGPLRRLGG